MLADINLPAAEKAVELIKERTPNAKVTAIRADVAVEGDIKGLVDKAVEQYGRLDVMVSLAISQRSIAKRLSSSTMQVCNSIQSLPILITRF